MRTKLISMQEAVAQYTWDGMQYANGGALPVGSDSIAFGREMIRQGRKNLHMISHDNSQQTNLLCAAGAVRKLEIAFTGLEVYGFSNGLKRAVETGKTIIEDYSNASLPMRLLGGALNWPYVPATVCIGSDIEWCSGERPDEYPCTTKIRKITDPFTGKDSWVFTVLKPDLAAIHVPMADIYGNAIMLGTEWSRYELSRAAKKVVLQADFIVDTDCMRQYPNLVRIPDVVVDAVVYWPMGAWPHCSTGIYDSDEKGMFAMNEAMKTEEGYEEYRKKYIDSYTTVEEYLDMIGRDKIAQLCVNPTTHLMDPYRKWIKTDAEIKQLMDGR